MTTSDNAAQPMPSTILSFEGVEAAYDRMIIALRGVSLVVSEGAVVALLGANGAGKTTTLKAASGLLGAERGAVTHGTIRYAGRDVATQTPRALVRDGLVQVLEGRHCFPHLTVDENLRTGALVRGIGRRATRDELEAIYDQFPRLAKLRGTLAGFTSGGEQQMVAIGRALMARPKLVLLDEPSMGLAAQIVDEIFRNIRALNRERGVSFLLAEQNARGGAAPRRPGVRARERARRGQRDRRGAERARRRRVFYLGGGATAVAAGPSRRGARRGELWDRRINEDRQTDSQRERQRHDQEHD